MLPSFKAARLLRSGKLATLIVSKTLAVALVIFQVVVVAMPYGVSELWLGL